MKAGVFASYNWGMGKLKYSSIYLMLLIALSSCFGGGSDDPVDTAVPLPGSVFDPVDPAEIGQCYQDVYPGVPENTDPKELDIMIVSYGAINLKPHRDRLADNLNYLIGSLSPNIDFRIGVIQGFGDHSSRSGKLYRRASEPYVLRSDSLTTAEIQAHVKSKLNPHALEVVLESIFGAGSMGMFSLYKALTENQAEIKAQGLLRDDASLLILFVSDQADVCAVYPDGVVTRNRTMRDHPHSSRAQAYARDCFPNDELLTAQRLFDKMENATTGSVSVGGVFYNNHATTPTAAWKEFGYGYTDVIQASNGVSHDLASSNYAEALAKIGSYTSANVVQDEFFNLNAQNILPGTIQVEVDGELSPFYYYPEIGQIQLVYPRSSLSEVQLSYCDRKLLDQRENLQVETGGNHTCALHRDGSVRCWGQNNFGQLGQGHSDNLGDNEPVASIDPLVFDERAIQISAGGAHTCAVFESGAVRCWGRNDSGQLGLGDTIHRGINERATELPTLSLGAAAVGVYAGTLHTCAILDNQTVRCWGTNNNGELGVGHTNMIGASDLPSDHSALNFGKDIIKLDISSISSHTCALFEDQTLKCWGRNMAGQLGLGDIINRGDTSTATSASYVSVDNHAAPIFVATGNVHSCVLLDTQDMKCWGTNTHAQLGKLGVTNIGAIDHPSDHTPVNFGISIMAIAASNLGTCVLTAGHGIRCWGDNRFGQTGLKSPNTIGTDFDITTLGDVDFSGIEMESIVGGTSHYCGLSKGDGRIICWGDNRQGQLGYGDNISSNSTLIGHPGTRGFIDFGFDYD